MTDNERWSSRTAQELLREFRETGAEAPFEEIVRRYAGMVFHVCLEVTKNRQDAEDGAQAAFLALAVHSKTSRPITAVGPWLRQVARRLALDIRKANRRRQKREERHGRSTPENGGNGDGPGHVGGEELRAVLLEELNALPARYRLPLILQYFGGLSRDEMARELGCNASTLGVRVFRARQMLADRLAARGIGLSGAMLGVALAGAVHAAVVDSLARCTCRAAAALAAGTEAGTHVISANVLALARGAIRAVALARCKVVAAVIAAAASLLAAGAGVLAKVRPADIRLPVSVPVPRPLLVPAKAPPLPLMLGSAEADTPPAVGSVSESGQPAAVPYAAPRIAGATPTMLWPSLTGGAGLATARHELADATGPVLQSSLAADTSPRLPQAAATAGAPPVAGVAMSGAPARGPLAFSGSAWSGHRPPGDWRSHTPLPKSGGDAAGAHAESPWASDGLALVEAYGVNLRAITAEGVSPVEHPAADTPSPAVPARRSVTWYDRGEAVAGSLAALSQRESAEGDYVRVDYYAVGDPDVAVYRADPRLLPPLPGGDAILAAWSVVGLADAAGVAVEVRYGGRTLSSSQPAIDDLRLWTYNGFWRTPGDDPADAWPAGIVAPTADNGAFHVAVAATPEPAGLLALAAAAACLMKRHRRRCGTAARGACG